MKKYQFILKTHQKNTALPNSKEIEESKNSLSSIKNKNQYYVEIEAQLASVFIFFTLANKEFMEKEQINSLFFKLVDQKDHKQIENIYKKYLEFQRDVKGQSIIDRVKIVNDTIKTHFQKLSKCKEFCDNQKVLRQLFTLYPQTTFKLKIDKKGKNSTSYIKIFQLKGTNKVIIAFFQQREEKKVQQLKPSQSSQSYSGQGQTDIESASSPNKTQQVLLPPKPKEEVKPDKKDGDKKQQPKSNKKEPKQKGGQKQVEKPKQVKKPKQVEKLVQIPINEPAPSKTSQWMMIVIGLLLIIFSMSFIINDNHLIQQLHDKNYLRLPQITQTVNYYGITQTFWSLLPQFFAEYKTE